MIRKIVITGPESTGKSSLARSLAEHYRSIFVPEFAREFLDEKDLSYNYDDLLTIAKGQVGAEDMIVSRMSMPGEHPLPVFMDTDLTVVKIWSEVKYENCHSWVLNQLAERQYDLYLLCDIDLPWEYDLMREAPAKAERAVLFKHYKETLIGLGVEWRVVGGVEDRVGNAVKIIDKFLILNP